MATAIARGWPLMECRVAAYGQTAHWGRDSELARQEQCVTGCQFIERPRAAEALTRTVSIGSAATDGSRSGPAGNGIPFDSLDSCAKQTLEGHSSHRVTTSWLAV